MHMRIAITLLVLLWACAIAPSLCVGGGLVHACDCGVECGHEEDCERDPCAPVLKSDSGSQRLHLIQRGGQVSSPLPGRIQDLLLLVDSLPNDRTAAPRGLEPAQLQPAVELPLLR